MSATGGRSAVSAVVGPAPDAVRADSAPPRAVVWRHTAGAAVVTTYGRDRPGGSVGAVASTFRTKARCPRESLATSQFPALEGGEGDGCTDE